MDKNTELRKRNILRQNNIEANEITRECIESALILLMKEKSFNEISITDIAKKAGVSRTAYYRNYSSKEDILSNYLQNIIKETSKILTNYNTLTETYESWIAFLKNMGKYASKYKLLLSAGYGDTILNEFKKCFNKNVTIDQTQLYYSNCYWAGALYSVLTEWISNDMTTPINKVAQVGYNLMTNGIHTIEQYGNYCE